MLSNTTLIVIPFFLGAVIEKVDEQVVAPKYTFHVRVDTLFTNHLPEAQILESNAGLSFEVACRPQLTNNLRCHIRKRNINYASSTDPVHMVDNHNFLPSHLVYSKIDFLVTFGNNGTTNYNITMNVTEQSILLEMYRMIGDQLSIGTNITSRGDEFNATENCYIGTCPTFYRITRNQNFNSNFFKLRSLLDSEHLRLVQNETLYISKQRRVSECTLLSNYILGKILWRDFIPANLTAKTNVSRSLMALSERDFHIRTISTFDLYDQENKTAGFIYETIVLRLTSVEV